MSSAYPSNFDAPVREVTIDLDAQAVYVRLRHAPVANTKPWNPAESVILDLDAAGRLIGIEILGLNTEIPIDELTHAYDFSEPVIRVLKELQESMWQASVTANSAGDLVPAPLVRLG